MKLTEKEAEDLWIVKYNLVLDRKWIKINENWSGPR